MEPNELIYVGDEVRDVKACLKAGVLVIGVTWGLNCRNALEASGASFGVDHPSELLAVINGVGTDKDAFWLMEDLKEVKSGLRFLLMSDFGCESGG